MKEFGIKLNGVKKSGGNPKRVATIRKIRDKWQSIIRKWDREVEARMDRNV